MCKNECNPQPHLQAEIPPILVQTVMGSGFRVESKDEPNTRTKNHSVRYVVDISPLAPSTMAFLSIALAIDYSLFMLTRYFSRTIHDT